MALPQLVCGWGCFQTKRTIFKLNTFCIIAKWCSHFGEWIEKLGSDFIWKRQLFSERLSRHLANAGRRNQAQKRVLNKLHRASIQCIPSHLQYWHQGSSWWLIFPIKQWSFQGILPFRVLQPLLFARHERCLIIPAQTNWIIFHSCSSFW